MKRCHIIIFVLLSLFVSPTLVFNQEHQKTNLQLVNVAYAQPSSGAQDPNISTNSLGLANTQDVDLLGKRDPTKIQTSCDLNKPGSWLAGCWTGSIIFLGGGALLISGAIFDGFLQFTLNPSYLTAPYIETSWVLVRDLANMAFILGIIVVALLMITGFSGGGFDWKKIARNLIIVALLLNFSLFFSRVIIDTGNILGNFFYQAIITDAPDAAFNIGDAVIPVGSESIPETKSPSAKIVQAVDPIRMMGVSTINKLTDDGDNHGFLFGFNVMYGIITLGVAFSLFTTGFMFLSRTIALIILMITSPIMFVTLFIPKLDNLFWSWLNQIFKRSFCICIYLFLIYLLLIIVSGTAAAPESSDFWHIVIFTAVNVFLVVGLLRVANKQARNFCEGDSGINIGSMLSKWSVGTAATVGTGALGVGALAARSGVGQVGYAMSKGKLGVGSLATSNNPVVRGIGQLGLYTGDQFQKAKIGGKSFEEAQKAGSKRLEEQGNRLANLKEEEVKKDLEKKYISEDNATYLSRGMSKEEAGKLAEATGKKRAGAEAKEQGRAFGRESIKATNSALNLVMAGAGGTGSEALATFNAVDKKEKQKQENKLAKLEEQRTYQMNAQNRQTEIRTTLQQAVNKALNGEDLTAVLKELGEAIKPLYMSRKIEDGKQVSRFIPGTPHAQAFETLMNSATGQLNQVATTIQEVVHSQADAQLATEVLSHVEDNIQQGWAADEQVTPEEIERLKSLGVKVSDSNTITYDDSHQSLKAAISVSTKNAQSSQKEVQNISNKIIPSIMQPVDQQVRAESQARANIATAEVEGIIEEARLGQDQVKDGRVEDQSREEKDVGNGSGIGTAT